MKLSKIVCASLFCTVSIVFAENEVKLTHEVIGHTQGAYNEIKGYVAKKSSTGSKMDVDILEIPQSVSVITKDMLETRGAQSIQNATAYTSSVIQSYGENGDTRTNYGRLRGIHHLYDSTFLDGLKLLKGDNNLIPNFDAYALQRVEILKGPSSVLYGASGPGGLANLQSKKPNQSKSKEIGISYRSKSNKSIFFDTNHEITKNIDLRVTSKFKEGDNHLKDSTNKSYFFNPALAYYIDDDTTLDLNASIAKTQTKGLGLTFNATKSKLIYHNSIAANAQGIKDYIDGLNPAFTAIPDSLYVNNIKNSAAEINALNIPSNHLIGLKDEEIFEKEHLTIGGVLNKTFDENKKLRSSFRIMRQEGKYDFSRPNNTGLIPVLATLSPDLTKFPMEFIQIESSVNTLVLDNNIEFKSKFNNIKNTSLFGIDLQYSDFDKKEKRPVSYTYDLKNLSSNFTSKNSETQEDINTKIFQMGLYGSNSMNINEKFILNTSLRFDKVHDETKGKRYNSNTSSYDSANSKQIDDNVSGRVGLTYLLNESIAPYITYSTSFTTNIGSNPNGNKFKPSVGEQYELGIKYSPNSFNGLITLAAFDITQKDIIESNSLNQNVQEGDINVKGLEFDVIAEPIENLNLTFSFSKFNGEYENMARADYNGLTVNGLADYTASIWSDYTFKNTALGDVKIGAGAKYIGDVKNISRDFFDLANSSPKKEYDVDSYTIVDAVIGTKYKNWDLALNAYNLFDKEAKLDNMPLRYLETTGRTFTFTAKYKF